MTVSGGEAFERLLDEELGRVAAAEPRVGIEGRVLARMRGEVRVQAEKSRRGFWDIGWVGGLAACGLAGALMVLPLRRERDMPKMLKPTRLAQRSAVTAASPKDKAEPSGSGSGGGRRRVGVRTRGFGQARSFVMLGAASGGRAEVVDVEVPRRKDKEASLVLVRRYAEEASEGLGEPEDLAVRPLELAEVKVAPLGGRGTDRGSSIVQENGKRSDR